MGGYVNIAVRRAGSVQTHLSYTGALSRFFNPALYAGDAAALQQIFDVYPDIHEDAPKCGIRFAPYHYGLIVLDFDSRALVDMQCGRHLLQAFPLSLPEPGIPITVVLAAGKEGMLGDHLVDQISGEAAGQFPLGLFDSARTLFEWIRGPALRSSPHADAIPHLPSFHLHPPGWTHEMFAREEGAALLNRLLQLGFSISEEDQSEWEAWQREHAPAEEGEESA